jgi:hypothetical protein
VQSTSGIGLCDFAPRGELLLVRHLICLIRILCKVLKF